MNGMENPNDDIVHGTVSKSADRDCGGAEAARELCDLMRRVAADYFALPGPIRRS